MAVARTSARWPWITAVVALLLAVVGVVCVVAAKPARKAALDVPRLGHASGYTVAYSA
jgi:hypothetical protein